MCFFRQAGHLSCFTRQTDIGHGTGGGKEARVADQLTSDILI